MRKILVFFSILIFVTSYALPSQAVPTYTFPVQGCKFTYAHSHHNYPATDILAPKGCKFVAPISGVIDEVNRVDRFTWKTNLGADRGGLFISLIGDDGVRYYGSHLSKIPVAMAPGLHVMVGDVIGYLGATGDSKGLAPHVHFGISWPTPSGTNIWWVRRGELYPWPYLDAWKAGKDKSPASAVAKLLAKSGEIPKQIGY
jgi:murein DD-endopeptidase MepM/ murein hydrolase activator NlpD